jgi:hypothetical protein
MFIVKIDMGANNPQTFFGPFSNITDANDWIRENTVESWASVEYLTAAR